MVIDESRLKEWDSTVLVKTATQNKGAAWLCLICTLVYGAFLIGMLSGMQNMEPEFQELVPGLSLFALVCGGILGCATVSLFKKQRLLQREIRRRNSEDCGSEILLVAKEDERKAIRRNATYIAVAFAAIIVLGVIIGLSTDDSEGSVKKPWEDLGVSESEYMKVYNYYKYGEWSGD